MGSIRAGLAGAVIVLVAAACGSDLPADTPPATPTATAPSPTASGPSGPPSAQVSITGDASIAGAMTIDTVECSFPAVAGEEIFVTGTSAASASTSIHLTMTANAFQVVADTGAGTGFHVRTFSGTGVSGFDAATGAKLSGSVTETTPSSDNGTGIGKITSLSATITCAGQTPGSTTMAITGTVAAGIVSGAITDVHVVCMTNEAETLGIVQVGGSPAFTAVFSLAGKFTVDLAGAAVPVGFFVSTAAATSTPTTTGTTVNGDAAEQVAAGATAHTIHVSGTSTCGSGITP